MKAADGESPGTWVLNLNSPFTASYLRDLGLVFYLTFPLVMSKHAFFILSRAILMLWNVYGQMGCIWAELIFVPEANLRFVL